MHFEFPKHTTIPKGSLRTPRSLDIFEHNRAVRKVRLVAPFEKVGRGISVN